MNPIIALIDTVLSLAEFVVFCYAMILLLANFNIINVSQPFVQKIIKFLSDLIEPVLNKIRKYVKPYNNIDLAPLVLLIAIYFVRYTIVYYLG